jgi:hypothetical protein
VRGLIADIREFENTPARQAVGDKTRRMTDRC